MAAGSATLECAWPAVDARLTSGWSPRRNIVGPGRAVRSDPDTATAARPRASGSAGWTTRSVAACCIAVEREEVLLRDQLDNC